MQPEYFVNVLSGSTVQGSGPLTSISSWTVTRRMDAAGSWSFRMAAADAQAAQVVLKRSVEVYAYIGTSYLLVTSGIIDSIARSVDSSGQEVLVVSGVDDLQELAYRTVKDLSIQQYNSAENWILQQEFTGTITGITALVYANGVMLAGSNIGGIYYSLDGGTSWIFAQYLSGRGIVDRLFLVEGTSNIFWAVTSSPGLTYTGGTAGRGWSVRAGSYAHNAGPVSWAYAAGSTIWLMSTGASSKIYKYTGSNPPDPLVSWTDKGALGAETRTNVLLWTSATAVLAGTSPNGHIYRSTNSGDTWSDIGALGSETDVNALVDLGGGVVLAGTSPNAYIYRSLDSGASWTQVMQLGSETDVNALADRGDGFALAGSSGAQGSIFLGEPGIRAETHSNAVQIMEDLAPAGWTFEADADPGNDDLFIQFAGETLLAAVLRLAERSDTHCYLSSRRNLKFTREWVSSGVAAIQPQAAAALGATTVALIEMEVGSESYDIVTRVYPYGRDSDGARMGIIGADLTIPSGFTVNQIENWVQHDASYASYGLIEKWVSFNDIATQTTDRVTPGNALILAAMKYLTDASAPVINYRIALGGCSQLLLPMQQIRLTYFGEVRIDAEFYILESSWSGDDSGMITTGLTVSDAPIRIETGIEIIAKSIQRVGLLEAR